MDAHSSVKEHRQMDEEFYRELDPEKRWKILQSEPESEEKNRAQELFLLRHQDKKTGQNNFLQDRFLWFLVTLELEGSRQPVFAKREAKKMRRELRNLLRKDNADDTQQLRMDAAFLLEMKNAAERFFLVSGQEGAGRRLLGVGQPDPEIRRADQAMNAWRMVYGAPMYLNLSSELKPVCDIVREAYCAADPEGAVMLETLDRKKRPKAYRRKDDENGR